MSRNKLIPLLLLLASTLLTAPPAPATDRCGFKPFKPFIPFGCIDLVAVCTCDTSGFNCHWEWICVVDH